MNRVNNLKYVLSDYDRVLFRGLKSFVILLIGVIEKIFHVVDDGDVKRAARATSNLFTELKILLGDLEQVAAGARVGEGLKFVVPLHVFNLHVVVGHSCGGESETAELGR